MTTTADRTDTDRTTTPRHTWRTETTTSRTRPVDQGGDTPMMLTQLLDLHEASDALGEAIPCRENDAELWFADTPDGVEFAKALCGTCPVVEECLTHAVETGAMWGIWGGQLFEWGVLVPKKRPRGRPRKETVAA